MSDHDVLRIEAHYRRWRYLFDDGRTLDVDSPYRADSNDRDAVLAEAARRWGKRDGRKIVGAAEVQEVGPDAPRAARNG